MTKNKEVKILDTTLRDGSYINRFQFSTLETAFLVENLESAGLQLIEIGHGLGFGAYRKGGEFSAAATDEEYLKAAVEVRKKSKIGMFCIPGIAEIDDIEMAVANGIGFIRVGTNVTEVEQSRPFVERAKKHGLFVCANYMKSYALSPAEIAEKVKISKSYGVDMVYIVDSAGGMLPSELEACVSAIREKIEMPLGYHGHNNLGLAVSNSLLAVEIGVDLIDCSLQGLGRSAGNAPTEQMAMVLSRAGYEHGIDIFKVLDLGFETVQPILVQMGLNPIDLVSGYALFHSSYMPLIRKYSTHYCVDPRELIIELCKIDQVNAPAELVEKIARGLKPKDKKLFLSKYHLERYYVNEQK